MPLVNGSLSIKRFRVFSASNSPVDSDWLLQCLKKKKIRPLDPKDSMEESVGWCHPMSGEAEFNDTEGLLFDSNLLFGLRMDKKRLPPTYFKLQYQSALVELMAQLPAQKDEAGDGKVRIPRKLRDQAKQTVRDALLKQCIPNVKIIEALWQLDSSEVWLMNTSPAVVGLFESLFFETFGMSLIQVNGGTMGLQMDQLQGGKKISLKPMFDLQPIRFAEGNA